MIISKWVKIKRKPLFNIMIMVDVHTLFIIIIIIIIQRFSRAGPRGRGREWATLGVHPLSWLLSNNRLEKVPVVSVPHTSSNRLLLSDLDKGCTPSVAHSLPLPLGPALLNLSSVFMLVYDKITYDCNWAYVLDISFSILHTTATLMPFLISVSCIIPSTGDTNLMAELE